MIISLSKEVNNMLLEDLEISIRKEIMHFFTFISLKVKKKTNKKPIKYKNHKKFSIIHKKVTKLT